MGGVGSLSVPTLGRWEGSAFAAVAVIQLARVIPPDHLHKGVDISGGSRTVIDVIGVFIHVERKDRPSTGERSRVVHGPLVDQLAVAW